MLSQFSLIEESHPYTDGGIHLKMILPEEVASELKVNRLA